MWHVWLARYRNRTLVACSGPNGRNKPHFTATFHSVAVRSELTVLGMLAMAVAPKRTSSEEARKRAKNPTGGFLQRGAGQATKVL